MQGSEHAKKFQKVYCVVCQCILWSSVPSKVQKNEKFEKDFQQIYEIRAGQIMLNRIKNIEYFGPKITAYCFQNQFSAFCLKWIKTFGHFSIKIFIWAFSQLSKS